MTSKHTRAIAALGLCGLAIPAAAQLTPIGPFSGAFQEDYESFPVGNLASPAPVFGGAATLTGSLFIYGPGQTYGLVGNGSAQPFSGVNGFGLNSATQTATITFNAPVIAFGGYWSHSTSGVNQFELTFRDAGGALIGAEIHSVVDPSGNLHWFGWSSTTPIVSVEIGGRFTVNDFLQATPVPAPAAALVLVAAGALAPRRRR